MKRLFFLLLVGNLLVYMGARALLSSVDSVDEIAGGGDIRFLTINELKILRATAEAEKEQAAKLVEDSPLSSSVSETSPAEATVGTVGDDERQNPTVSGDLDIASDGAAEFKVLEDLKAGNVSCLSLGPLESDPEAKALVRSLAGQNMAGIVRWEEATQPQSYWVVLPADSDSEAANLMKKLRDGNQKDLWWIPGWRTEGGYFSRRLPQSRQC